MRTSEFESQQANFGDGTLVARMGPVVIVVGSPALDDLASLTKRSEQVLVQAVVWLAADASDCVHGNVLYIDGGMMLYPGFREGG